MKRIENYSNRLLHFELARLQTLFDNKPEIRNRIIKRYKEVKQEYENRKLRITWGEHELDKLLKNEVRENFDKNIESIKYVLKVIKVDEAKHNVGPLKGESIIGVYSYAVTNGRGIEVAKNSILKFNEEDYVEGYRDLDGKIKLVGKADYGIENGKFVSKDGKFIFEVENKET